MDCSKVAAKWWADKLRRVGPGNFNNGDNSSAGGFAMLLATMLAIEEEPMEESINLFEEKLAEAIKERVDTVGAMTLSVDYGPDGTLSSIAHETGVSVRGFPWKTTMWIEKDEVTVRSGYGAPEQKLFP